MAVRTTPVRCPVCGTDSLYTARGVDARDHHHAEWLLDADGMVLVRWRTGDGEEHRVRLAPDEVFCSGCHTRVAVPAPWDGVWPPLPPWPRVFFRGA